MLSLHSLRARLTIATTFALILAAMIVLSSPIQPETASAQCSTVGCSTSPYYGNGYNGTGYNSGYPGSGSCGNSYYSCGNSSIYNGQSSGCQQVLFSSSGCVTSNTSSPNGGSCAGMTLSSGQTCSNGVVSCQQGVSCSGAGGVNINHCPTTFTTPQCTGATTTTSAPAQTIAAAIPPSSANVTCPGGGFAPSLGSCGAGTTLNTSLNTGLNTGTGSALPATGFQVSLASGWNLIAGPAGTTLPGSGLLTFQAGDTTYETVPAGTPFKAGVGYWAFLPFASQVTLSAASGSSTSVTLPAGQPVMIGNPGNTPATVTGADQVFVLAPGGNNYTNGTQLQPGQGAWAMSTNGGQATIANAPASQSTFAPSASGS